MGDVLEPEFALSFPAIRGVQAGQEYYVAMCPFGIIPKMIQMDVNKNTPEHRAQRELNPTRVPQIARYLIDNQGSYVLSSLTVSIDGIGRFEPIGHDNIGRKVGKLTVPMDARIWINDGQHRRAAIAEALQTNPRLASETISVVFFIDSGLQRSQQMFADLNRYGVRPTKSISILYDHRDPMARLVGDLVRKHPIFKDFTELSKSTISNRSRKLFTLSSIYLATCRLLGKREGEDVAKEEEELIHAFWATVDKNIEEWRKARAGEIAAADLRKDYIHAHGIALQSLAIAGVALLGSHPHAWEREMKKLRQMNWRRDCATWEGRALIGGRVSKAQNNVILTANLIKQTLGLSLTAKEIQIEQLCLKGKSNGN